MSRKFSPIALVALTMSLLFPQQASAVVITFDNDTPGVYPNPFTSIDSALVNFSEVGSGAIGLIGINQFQSTSNVFGTGAGPAVRQTLYCWNLSFLSPRFL